MTSRRARPRLAAAAALALLALAVAGCSSSDDGGGGDNADAGGSVAAQAGADSAQDAPAEAEAPEDAQSASRAVADTSGQGNSPDVEPSDGRALIKTGNVSLRAADVDQVRFDVTTLVVKSGGEVSQDNAESDKEGKAERARLTVRVPEEVFADVMQGLEGVAGAETISLSTNTEDVSTQVIDTDVRVANQRRSIDRISLLLDRAQNIRDIVNIERELARREADLGSLQKRQAFLADQTSMATINVAIQRPVEKKKVEEKKKEKDENGFVAGLSGGWDAFQSVTTGLLTGTGAVLPFAVVALVVGVPVWMLVRRRHAAGAPGTPAASDPQSA